MLELRKEYIPGIDWLNTDDTRQAGVEIGVVRLDKIHPLISGNKLFKLHYFILDALSTGCSGLATFGGAYSNHLLAVAAACQIQHLQSFGFVRGEKPHQLSTTLTECEAYGMKLQFLSRKDYTVSSQKAVNGVNSNKIYIIPEGGFHPLGARGASLIIPSLLKYKPDFICTAVGTATTLAGLLRTEKPLNIIAVPVLKNFDDLKSRVEYLNSDTQTRQPILVNDFHFGGYAKSSPLLYAFMNSFYIETGIPTDFVYTAKLMFGVINIVKSGFFRRGSRILCLHTGGLQGNRSLKTGTLVF